MWPKANPAYIPGSPLREQLIDAFPATVLVAWEFGPRRIAPPAYLGAVSPLVPWRESHEKYVRAAGDMVSCTFMLIVYTAPGC